MRILITDEYNNIQLSRKAIDRLVDLTGNDISTYIFEDDGEEFIEHFDDSYRSDPYWLQVYDELGEEFSENEIELVEIPDNSNFYIYHHDWAGENVVLQTFSFQKDKIRCLLPDVEGIDAVLELLENNPNLVRVNTNFIENKEDLLYKNY